MGITDDYKRALGTCWTFVPKNGPIEKGRIFASVETAKCLVSFRSPVSGSIERVNDDFVAHPDTITSEAYLIKVK